MSTAKESFSADGYATTSIEDIADKLGVRKGAVYYHVPRKSDLLIYIVSDLLRPFVDFADEIALDDEADPQERLSRLVRQHVDSVLSDQAAARVFFEQYRDLPVDQTEVWSALVTKIKAAYDKVLEQGVASGHFRPSPTRLLRLHVLALCNAPYRWFDPDGSWSRAEIAESVWEQVGALVSVHMQL